MEAQLVDELPTGTEWQYEPKWDGFRCLAFRDGDTVELQSKAGQPLGALLPGDRRGAANAVGAKRFVLDGEIVVPVDGALSFDELLLRIHPAASRVQQARREHSGVLHRVRSARRRRRRSRSSKRRSPNAARALEAFAATSISPARRRLRLSPATTTMRDGEALVRARVGGGARRRHRQARRPRRTGRASATACRRSSTCAPPTASSAASATRRRASVVGSLLLGLYDDDGLLHHVGFTSNIPSDEKRGADAAKLEAARSEPPGFTGQAPGGPSRWSTERTRRVAAARAEARRRGAVRPLHRRPLPPRHALPPLASRQGAAPVHDGAGGAGGALRAEAARAVAPRETPQRALTATVAFARSRNPRSTSASVSSRAP